ncbi:hypothetical protein OCV73_00065 [Barnesiella propionica]|uniref:hypothetical protein n=1 Tax=Barnesiella propionica TaxID=2981781 RepID=UPI0011CB5974|nr:hypothetical protein [Barnesiella propionica]MCU6767356.1 hypothetical protein [Barnesiella propionica]
MENLNDPDKLESYKGPGAFFPKYVDERNSRKIMQKQFDLIKQKEQEIIELRKYREESRISAKRSFKFVILGIIIALLTLIATIIGWFI